MQRLLRRIVPWLITVVALYYAFRGIDWGMLLLHIKSVAPGPLLAAFALTCLSYGLRARRWQSLFPRPVIDYPRSLMILLLGFFMNNILPARAGEFVRAHMGARATGETRTLVLATIASERLADGVMLSLFFVIFALGLGDQETGHALLYVAYLFALATVSVAVILLNRAKFFRLAEKINQRVDSKASRYASHRLQVFFDGLSPLYSRKTFPVLCIWSLIIWSAELSVYHLVQTAFGADLGLQGCVLFMVTVNFSSLIPAAPAGIGVIEAVTSTVLVSLGIPKEQALSMVITQHVMQYVIVGIPGAFAMLRLHKSIPALEREIEEGEDEQQSK